MYNQSPLDATQHGLVPPDTVDLLRLMKPRFDVAGCFGTGSHDDGDLDLDDIDDDPLADCRGWLRYIWEPGVQCDRQEVGGLGQDMF